MGVNDATRLVKHEHKVSLEVPYEGVRYAEDLSQLLTEWEVPARAKLSVKDSISGVVISLTWDEN